MKRDDSGSGGTGGDPGSTKGSQSYGVGTRSEPNPPVGGDEGSKPSTSYDVVVKRSEAGSGTGEDQGTAKGGKNYGAGA